MKKVLCFVLPVFLILSAGCKKEKKFTEAYYILGKWTAATRNLDYRAYRECEANPKESAVFNEMFRDRYYDSARVISISKLDEDDIHKDPLGMAFMHREVSFECTEISRRTGRTIQAVKGDVLFIHYTEGKRKNDGWLMLNRTMIRTGMK